MPSITASPATGPSRIATATARFSATTGDGATRASTSYRPTISFQSVSDALRAPACSAAIAACSV